MELYQKPGLILAGIFFAVAVGYALLFKPTDRQKYESLQIGMTAGEVRQIIYPPSGGRYRAQPEVRNDEILRLNDCMILTLANGQLVHKEWIGPDDESGSRPSGR